MLPALLALAVLAAPRAVWTEGAATHQGSPSPDGKWLSCVDPETGDLAVRDLASGAMRRLTAKKTPGEFAYFSTISPDSRRAAYAWFNEEGFYDLRVVAIAGGEPKMLFRSEEAGFVQPSAWSPDGKWILTLFFRKDNISQISLVPADGGEARVLKSLNWVYPKKMDFSPDGKWIVYDNFARDGGSDRDIYLLSADGSSERKLVEHAAEDLFPVWSPAGGRIYFASDRAGSMDLWSVAVKDGRAAGSPEPVRKGLGRVLPMGMTRDGALYYALRQAGAGVLVGTWNGRFASKPDRVADGWSPALSRDGKRLAWLAPSGAGNFGHDARTIAVRDVAAGADRPLPAKLAHMERLRWMRDGAALLISGSDGKGRGGVFQVDAATGAVKALTQSADAPFRGYDAVDTEAGIVVARGAELAVLPDRTLYRGTAPLEALASDGKRVAFVEGAQVKLWDGTAVSTIGSGKEWRALAAVGTSWIAAHSGGFEMLPATVDLGATRAVVTSLSVAGGYVAIGAGKLSSEIWALDGLPR